MARWRVIALTVACLAAAVLGTAVSPGSGASVRDPVIAPADWVLERSCGAVYVFAPPAPMRVQLVPLTGAPAAVVKAVAVRSTGPTCSGA